MDLVQQLLKRAQARLANLSEVNEETCSLALSEASELCGGKEAPSAVVLDLAWIRLKLYLKVELNAEDELLYDRALAFLKTAPLKNENGEKSSSLFYQCKNRRSIYD